MRSRKRTGHPLDDTADMKAWRKEFDKMTLEDHAKKLESLGLGKEDIREFEEDLGLQNKKKRK